MAQTARPLEIIVENNTSSDGSLEIARCFPLVHFIVLDQNTGFGRGNNLAIEAASAELACSALINLDAFTGPIWLEALLAATT